MSLPAFTLSVTHLLITNSARWRRESGSRARLVGPGYEGIRTASIVIVRGPGMELGYCDTHYDYDSQSH